jgi:hypothetical protein
MINLDHARIFLKKKFAVAFLPCHAMKQGDICG